jgi:hypothetical protein
MVMTTVDDGTCLLRDDEMLTGLGVETQAGQIERKGKKENNSPWSSNCLQRLTPE